MSYLHDDVLDAALQELIDNVDGFYLCSQEPTTYAEATSTYALGSKSSPTLGSIGNVTGGRSLTVSAFTDGSCSASGTATHWALVDSVTSKLYATQALSASQNVISGNDFTIDLFYIVMADPL